MRNLSHEAIAELLKPLIFTNNANGPYIAHGCTINPRDVNLKVFAGLDIKQQEVLQHVVRLSALRTEEINHHVTHGFFVGKYADRSEGTQAVFNRNNEFKSLTDLYDLLTTNPDHPIFGKLAQALTNQNSLLFTSSSDGFLQEHLPQIYHTTEGPIRVLSVGCAEGQEIFSYRMSIETNFPEFDMDRFQFVGIDISETAIEKAKHGLIDSLSVNPLFIKDPTMLDQYLYPRDSNTLALRDKYKNGIYFYAADARQPFSKTCGIDKFHIISNQHMANYQRAKAVFEILSNSLEHLNPNGIVLFDGSCQSYNQLETKLNTIREEVNLDQAEDGNGLIDGAICNKILELFFRQR